MGREEEPSEAQWRHGREHMRGVLGEGDTVKRG